MSTLQFLVDEVYTLTSRDDLIGDTLTALRAATLKAHQSDFFDKDLQEAAIQFDTSAYYQQLEYRNIFPRWRAIKYLRKYDAVGQAAGSRLTILTVDETMDKSYMADKTDIAYLAGSLYNIKSSTAEQYYLVGYYAHPDVTEATYNSWIALEHPYAIIYEAARTIFKTIGDDAKSASYDKLVAEQYLTLKQQLATVGE